MTISPMQRIREFFGLTPRLPGLESILDGVAAGNMTQEEAAEQIRKLAARPYIPPWLPRLFVLAGCIFLLVGLGFAAYSVYFASGAMQAPAIVTQMVGSGSGTPIVEYTVDGEQFTHRSPISSSPPAYVVGQKVSVLYRPANPSRAQLNTFTDRWLFAVVFTLGGFWAIICGYFAPKFIAAIAGT
jgi:hypothetical protein